MEKFGFLGRLKGRYYNKSYYLGLKTVLGLMAIYICGSTIRSKNISNQSANKIQLNPVEVTSLANTHIGRLLANPEIYTKFQIKQKVHSNIVIFQQQI